MSYNPQPKQSNLVKVLQRENVISYKKKPKTKDMTKSQQNNDQDTVSAHSQANSLQSGVYSEQASRMKYKANPLPDLGREKKRFLAKNLIGHQIRINNFQQKQVRQQDNLMLKQKNNFLTSQNLKLKTKISMLQKQNLKLQKMIEQQGNNKFKAPGQGVGSKDRFKGGDNLSTRILIKNLKKQLEQVKKQNANIKSSIKFTTIAELQCQRDAIMEQTHRLRAMLQEEQTRRLNMKLNQQGISHLEQRISSLQQRNNILMRQKNELNNKISKMEQTSNRLGKASQSQKNLNKMLYSVRRLLKEKEQQVERLKEQVKNMGSSQSIPPVSQQSIKVNQNSSRKPSVQRTTPVNRTFDRRVVSKSAQKMPKTNDKNIQKCQQCKKLKAQNQELKKKIAEFEKDFQSSNPLILSQQPVAVPNQQELSKLIRFVTFRFKAHHLSIEESEKYLLNTQNITQQQLQKQITVQQLMQGIVTQPFVVLNKRYIEILLIKLCHVKQIQKGAAKIKLDKDLKMKKKDIIQNYRKLIPPLELMPQAKEQQMFLQIAELVTSYYQHILAALTNRKNGQGTIQQKDFIDFFTQIELEPEYIDFIITQIILESLDLDRLNFFAFFEIFFMPQQGGTDQTGQTGTMPGQPNIADKKKKFQVDHVVKQQDEEYEQSRSYVDARQKTLSKKQDQSNDGYSQKQSPNSKSKLQSPTSQNKELNKNSIINQQQQHGIKDLSSDQQSPKKAPFNDKKQQQQKEQVNQIEAEQEMYQEEDFEEEKNLNDSKKLNKVQKDGKEKQKKNQLEMKPYQIEDIEAQYEEEFQT